MEVDGAYSAHRLRGAHPSRVRLKVPYPGLRRLGRRHNPFLQEDGSKLVTTHSQLIENSAHEGSTRLTPRWSSWSPLSMPPFSVSKIHRTENDALIGPQPLRSRAGDDFHT